MTRASAAAYTPLGHSTGTLHSGVSLWHQSERTDQLAREVAATYGSGSEPSFDVPDIGLSARQLALRSRDVLDEDTFSELKHEATKFPALAAAFNEALLTLRKSEPRIKRWSFGLGWAESEGDIVPLVVEVVTKLDGDTAQALQSRLSAVSRVWEQELGLSERAGVVIVHWL